MRFFGRHKDEVVTLRMTNAAGEAGSLIVDAFCRCGEIRGEPDTRAIVAAPTPVEIQLPPGDVAVMARQVGGAGELLCEYIVERHGERVIYHRSLRPMTLIVRRAGRVFSGGPHVPAGRNLQPPG